jgi:hypothetical protein
MKAVQKIFLWSPDEWIRHEFQQLDSNTRDPLVGPQPGFIHIGSKSRIVRPGKNEIFLMLVFFLSHALSIKKRNNLLWSQVKQPTFVPSNLLIWMVRYSSAASRKKKFSAIKRQWRRYFIFVKNLSLYMHW